MHCIAGVSIAAKDNVHNWVRLRFTFPADPDLKTLGGILGTLGYLRNGADYDLSTLPSFSNARVAQDSVQKVTTGIALLDAVDANSSRRFAAVVAIRKAFP